MKAHKEKQHMPPAADAAAALKDFVFTSESVAEGHPDKICDQISDAILDHYMTLDPNCRTAIECITTSNYLGIFGEARGPDSITHEHLAEIARKKIKDIGYEQNEYHWKKLKIDVKVHRQSADIAQGVDASGKKDEGAGDQGIMFGYACRETESLMPAAINFSHNILHSLAEARHSGALPKLGGARDLHRRLDAAQRRRLAGRSA